METVLDDQLHHVGVDDRGVELHIIAVQDDREPDGLRVIRTRNTTSIAGACCLSPAKPPPSAV